MITLEEVQRDLAGARKQVDQLTANLNGAIGIVSYLEAKEEDLLQRQAEKEANRDVGSKDKEQSETDEDPLNGTETADDNEAGLNPEQQALDTAVMELNNAASMYGRQHSQPGHV